MTTIVSDGKFLIADHRITSATNEYKKYGRLKTPESISVRADNSSKIFFQEIDGVSPGVMTPKGKILAIATTGPIKWTNFMLKVLMGSKLEKIEDAVDILKNLPDLEGRLLGITTEGWTIIVQMKNIKQVVYFPPGHICVFTSMDAVDSVISREPGKVSLVERFLGLTHLDKTSSCSHDIFDSDTKIIKTVYPDENTINNAVKVCEKNIVFLRGDNICNLVDGKDVKGYYFSHETENMTH